VLKNTFCHIPGVGPKSERRFWEKGILSWEACLDAKEPCLSRSHIRENVTASLERFEARDLSWFIDRLAPREHWRLFPDFRGNAAYIDIETNGFVGERGYITAISLYDGSGVRSYVRGENLADFKRDIEAFGLIVTYNGRCFDIPFIETHMGISLAHIPHIDLRFILRDLGFRGGLKGSELALGIDRGGLKGVDGYSAVLLWRDFRRNKDRKALETLLAYNAKDVVNLEPLFVKAYNMKIESTPFAGTHLITAPERPVEPYKADAETVERILSVQARFSAHGAV